MTLIICESLREIGEMACVTPAWSSRGQTLKLSTENSKFPESIVLTYYASISLTVLDSIFPLQNERDFWSAVKISDQRSAFNKMALYLQPRSQDLFPGLGVEREKALGVDILSAILISA